MPLFDHDEATGNAVAENLFHGLGHGGASLAGPKNKDPAAGGEVDLLARN